MWSSTTYLYHLSTKMYNFPTSMWDFQTELFPQVGGGCDKWKICTRSHWRDYLSCLIKIGSRIWPCRLRLGLGDLISKSPQSTQRSPFDTNLQQCLKIKIYRTQIKMARTQIYRCFNIKIVITQIKIYRTQIKIRRTQIYWKSKLLELFSLNWYEIQLQLQPSKLAEANHQRVFDGKICNEIEIQKILLKSDYIYIIYQAITYLYRSTFQSKTLVVR